MSEDLICEVCERKQSETDVEFSDCWVGTLTRSLCWDCYKEEMGIDDE